MKSDTASANGSLRSRKRSKSRESERRRPRRDRDDYRSSGDFYRGGGRAAPALPMMIATTGPISASVRKKDAPAVDLPAATGPVKDAQIVKDRVSGRSKGVGYVEFKNEESVSTTFLACTRDKSLDLRSKA
ncbi:RNA recognition motif domaineukaryote [Penicillium sp. CMV-2018d]|nr:RNA recognition motif domaineukaryote [Penicillium sp. CMV-2018d]